MLAFAESKDDVLKALQRDVYFKEGVWDWNKVQIHPVCLHDSRLRGPSVLLTIISSSLRLGNPFRVPMSTTDMESQGFCLWMFYIVNCNTNSKMVKALTKLVCLHRKRQRLNPSFIQSYSLMS